MTCYYSDKTTSQNRSTNLTPYLCLKSRWIQIIIWNEYILLLLLVSLLVFIISSSLETLLNQLNSNTLTTQSGVKNGNVTLNYTNTTLDHNNCTIKLNNVTVPDDSTKIQDQWLSELGNLQMITEYQINITANSMLSLFALTIDNSYNSRMTMLNSSLSLVKQLNQSLLESFESQENDLTDLKDRIEDEAVFAKTLPSLDSMTLNYTWISDTIQDLEDDLSNSNYDIVRLYNNKTEILKLIDDRYQNVLTNCSRLFDDLLSDIENVETSNSNNTSDITIFASDLDKTSNLLREDFTQKNGSQPSPVKDANSKRLTDYAKILGIFFIIIGITIVMIQLIWEYLRYMNEQKQSFKLSEVDDEIKDQLAIPYKILDFESFKMSESFIKAMKLQEHNNLVKIHWLFSFWFGIKSKVKSFLMVIWFILIIFVSLNRICELIVIPVHNNNDTSEFTDTNILKQIEYKIVASNFLGNNSTSTSNEQYEITEAIREILDSIANNFKQTDEDINAILQDGGFKTIIERDSYELPTLSTNWISDYNIISQKDENNSNEIIGSIIEGMEVDIEMMVETKVKITWSWSVEWQIVVGDAIRSMKETLENRAKSLLWVVVAGLVTIPISCVLSCVYIAKKQ